MLILVVNYIATARSRPHHPRRVLVMRLASKGEVCTVFRGVKILSHGLPSLPAKSSNGVGGVLRESHVI